MESSKVIALKSRSRGPGVTNSAQGPNDREGGHGDHAKLLSFIDHLIAAPTEAQDEAPIKGLGLARWTREERRLLSGYRAGDRIQANQLAVLLQIFVDAASGILEGEGVEEHLTRARDAAAQACPVPGYSRFTKLLVSEMERGNVAEAWSAAHDALGFFYQSSPEHMAAVAKWHQRLRAGGELRSRRPQRPSSPLCGLQLK